MPNYRRKFEKIYNKHIDKIYRFIFLKVGTQEVAEDLCGQVFAKGWRKFKSGAGIQNIAAYLYQIARAEIADYYRKEAKYKIVSAEVVQVVDPAASPEEIQRVQSDFEIVRASLNKINEDYQNALILRYIDGLSIKKIAEIMEKKEGAVRVMLHRALKELREKIGK